MDMSMNEKLRAIRNKTKLNQTEFYIKYLSDLNLIKSKVEGESPKESSIQGFMRKLEDGSIDPHFSILPVYARIAGYSVDELITGENFHRQQDIDKAVSIRDLCTMIYKLFPDKIYFCDVEVNEPDDYGLCTRQYTAIYFPDYKNPESDIMDRFIDNLQQLHNAWESGAFTEDDYKALVERRIESAEKEMESAAGQQ